MMEGVVDENAQLDYIEFQIFPTQNRYDAFVCYESKKEKVTSGPLECLLPHSPDAKALHSKGSNAEYKLTPPESTQDVRWFTKSTLIRFLCIIGSPNILNITSSVKNEMSQLEEARRFHLSLYAKADGSDASKNELLRAIDLRLTALEGELTTAFDQVTGSRLRVQEMTDIEKLIHHVGSSELSDPLRKYIELIQKNEVVDNSSGGQFLESGRGRAKEGNNRNTRSCSSETPVKYGVSPAKAAQVERQSSTGSEESSLSSEEERPSAERSRTLIRSASPRRSASPMRRIQVGRSGSRRSTAITIKSLSSFPVRERSFLPQDDSDDGEPTQPTRRADVNVNRISVKDAINLFESKQGDQVADIQKARSLLIASSTASKSVLRRWSSVVGEDSSRSPADVIPTDDSTQRQDDTESSASSSSSSPKVEKELNVSSDYQSVEPSGLDAKSSPYESTLPVQEETLAIESTNDDEKLAASTEWNRQKEAELNELLMKMMETKPAQSRNPVSDKSKRHSLPAKQRGGLYDNYKEKRDEKLRGETVRKKAEKDKQFKVMEKALDTSKSRLASASASTGDAGKKRMTNKVQKPEKAISQPSNPKKVNPKVDVVKKTYTKTSSLPATRKSWPSMPSPRVPGGSPAKTPVSTTPTVTAPSRRKSQPAPPVSRSSKKVDTSEPRTKSVKPSQADSKKTVKSVADKRLPVTKPAKTAKSKVHSASDDSTSVVKPSLYSKKGTVVPVESKPFLRKGSKTLPSNSQVSKTKLSSRSQNLTKKPEDEITIVQNETVEIVSDASDPVILHEASETKESTVHADTNSGISAESPQKCEADDQSFSPVEPINTDVFDHVLEPITRDDDIEEESTISPTAWVETEEHEDQPFEPSDHICQMGSPTFAAPVGGTSPRVRHSLSQMLLQETSEPDAIDWGNAENPPTMVYQKDAPKGFKRLLKFARKSKNDTNSTGWSSPSVFSEGEDDTDDSKSISRRSSENLLKKATLQSKNNGHQKSSYDTYRKNPCEYDHPAQANMSKINVQTLSQHILEGHASASPTMSKGSRSFFSLSAFKGSSK